MQTMQLVALCVLRIQAVHLKDFFIPFASDSLPNKPTRDWTILIEMKLTPILIFLMKVKFQ